MVQLLSILIFFFSFLLPVDTDSDGYLDEIEIKLGTDPNDYNSRYYWGGWPVNLEKDKIQGQDLPYNCPSSIGCECTDNSDCVNSNCQRMPRGKYCMPKVGDTFPRFYAFDQYGEIVDLYDFANQGKMIAVEFGAAWCSPCKQLSSFLHNDGLNNYQFKS